MIILFAHAQYSRRVTTYINTQATAPRKAANIQPNLRREAAAIVGGLSKDPVGAGQQCLGAGNKVEPRVTFFVAKHTHTSGKPASIGSTAQVVPHPSVCGVIKGIRAQHAVIRSATVVRPRSSGNLSRSLMPRGVLSFFFLLLSAKLGSSVHRCIYNSLQVH